MNIKFRQIPGRHLPRLLLLFLLQAGNVSARQIPVVVILERDALASERQQLARELSQELPEHRQASRLRAAAEAHTRLQARARPLAALGLQDMRVTLAGEAVAGWINEADLKALQGAPGVAEVFEDIVLEPLMDVSVAALLPDEFYAAGFRGQASDFEVGVLDAGIDSGHPAFDGLDIRFNIDHFNASRDPTYNDSWTNPDDLTEGGHGTHIAGIIAGRPAPTWEQHVGVAPALPRLYNLKSGFRRTNANTAGLYFSDALDNIDWGLFDAADDIDSLNFSWGITATADDSGLARFFDAMVDDLGVPVVIAAGNSGPSARTITDPGIAYNVLTIGATNDAGTVLRLDDNVTGNSSRGPTIGGRKKPDLVAPGFIITSPTNFWESALDYNSVSGTSFAAPHALGAVQLVMDYLGPGADPRQVKALLIASATPGSVYDSSASVEWDDEWGWGYINLERAFAYRQSLFTDALPPAGAAGDYRLYRGPMEPVQRAALVWNRHVDYAAGGGEPSTAGALNDLNMRLYDHADGTQLDSSTSGIDNVEVVSITAREYETVLKVYSADSSFSRVSLESYALSTPPGFTLPDTLPSPRATMEFFPGNPGRLVAVVRNAGDFHAHSVTGALDLPSNAQIVAGLEDVAFGTLLRNNGELRIVEWLVDGMPAQEAELNLRSASYGETFTGAASISLGGQPNGLQVTLATEGTAAPGGTVELLATIANSSPTATASLEATLTAETGLIVQSGAFTQTLPQLAPGEEATAVWLISPEEAGTLRRVYVKASGQTVGGGTLGGGATAAISALPEPPGLALSVTPLASDSVEPGSFFQVNASITNMSTRPAENLFVELQVPAPFALGAGSIRQAAGALQPEETRTAGQWLVIAPGSQTVGDFVLSVDEDETASASTPFRIAVGRTLPEPASPFIGALADEPLLQQYTGSSDNDPTALGVLPNGGVVFYNAQTGDSPAHEALLFHDQALPGTAAFRVLATRDSIRSALGSTEPVTIEDIAVTDDGSVHLLARMPRSGSDPHAILTAENLGNGLFAPLRVAIPPGLPPFGIPPAGTAGGHAIAWDTSADKLVVLVDDGTTSSDLTTNGLYRLLPQEGQIELAATFQTISQGLRPLPVAGEDPIGFAAVTVDQQGNAYLINTGGLGGNRGDIVRVGTAGQANPFVDDALLSQQLPANFLDLPIRMHWNPVRNCLAILVSETESSAAHGDGILTEWTVAGTFAGIPASRSQLLLGTGAGYLFNAGDAFTSNRAGDYLLWSSADNEHLLRIANQILLQDELTIY